ncbi:MAG: GerMN domain-containing protein [Lachnospiraceae bacterium]|nr:GerMN domain-containing protein [Lachnospiraceae bacterium]
MNKRYPKTYLIVLCLLVSVLGTACQGSTVRTEDEDGYRIYYLNKEETQVVSEAYKVDTTDSDKELLKNLIHELNEGIPSNLTYEKALPENVTLSEIRWKDHQLTINVSAEYERIPNETEVLCRAAIVKTLCQVEGIDTVEMYLNGNPITDNAGVPVGLMSAEDFIDNTGGETNFEQNITLTLYFAEAKGKKLIPTNVNIIFDGTISVEELVLSKLIEGPEEIENLDTSKTRPVIAKDTKLNSVSIKDGVCNVDFSQEFLEGVDGVEADTSIYAIVDSLVEIGNIDRVKFTVEGEEVKTYLDKNNFDTVFERNLDIVISK